MAQRHQVRGALGRLDRGDARHADHVALLCAARGDQRQRRRLHADRAGGARDAVRLGLGRRRRPCGPGRARRSGSAANSCGETSGKRFRGIIATPAPNFGHRHRSNRRPHGSRRVDHLPHSFPAAAAPDGRPVRRAAARAGCAAARAAQPAVTGRCGQPRTSASAPNAASATRSCARSAATRTTSTTRCCSNTCSRCGRRWSRKTRALGNIGPEIDSRFAWEVFLVRDRSVNAFALPGGYVGVHLGLIAITDDARRARLGARPRDVARHAAPHRAQHREQQAPVADRHRGADRRRARGEQGQQRRRGQRRDRRQPGRDDAGAAQLLARHGARSRPHRLFGDDGRRLRAWRHGVDVREARPRLAPERQRQLPVPAQPPADERAHRRGALARGQRCGAATAWARRRSRRARSNTCSRRRAHAC